MRTWEADPADDVPGQGASAMPTEDTGQRQPRSSPGWASGLQQLGREGRHLLPYLPLFLSRRFMPEAMAAVCRPTDPDWVRDGLAQMEQGSVIVHDPNYHVYTFDDALLGHLERAEPLTPQDCAAGAVDLLVFYGRYVNDNRDDALAIDRCADDVLARMDAAWQADDRAGHVDVLLASMVDSLGRYLERRRLWQAAETWHARAVELHRHSPVARDNAALAHALALSPSAILAGRSVPPAAGYGLQSAA